MSWFKRFALSLTYTPTVTYSSSIPAYPTNYVYCTFQPPTPPMHSRKVAILSASSLMLGSLCRLCGSPDLRGQGQRDRPSFGRAHHAGRESSRAAKCRVLSSRPRGAALSTRMGLWGGVGSRTPGLCSASAVRF